MLGLALLLAVGLALFWGMLTWQAARLIGRPPRRTYAWTVSRGVPGDPSELIPARAFEPISLDIPGTRGAPIPVWDIRGDEPRAPVVVFSHGWGESRIAVLQRIGALAPHCSRIVAWDMPGHGERPNGPSPLGTHEASELAAIVAYARGERLDSEGFDLQACLEGGPRAGSPPIVLHGFSLGAGVSLACAALAPAWIDGVIAEAPYRLPWTPARNVLRDMGLPWRTNLMPAMWMLGAARSVRPSWRGFDRAVIASRVHCPVLVIHGTADEVCPIEDGRKIANATAHGRIVEIPGARHLELWTVEPHRAACAAATGEFLRGILRS